jgi:general secretion pathway protein I
MVFDRGDHVFMDRKMGPRKALQAGFTLLETMVAISIIAIVIVAIYQLHAQTIAMTIDSQFYAISPLLAQKKLAEIKLSPQDKLGDGAGDFGDAFPGYVWKTAVSDIESEVLGAVAENMKQVDISVSFNDDERTYQLRAYLLVENET